MGLAPPGLASHLRASSFYVDCSAATMGLPEGMEPRVRCAAASLLSQLNPLSAGRPCRPLREECLHLRRALDAKSQSPKKPRCMTGEQAYVHFLDGDMWLRCCVTGSEGQERSDCEALYPPTQPTAMPAQALDAIAGMQGAAGKLGGRAGSALQKFSSAASKVSKVAESAKAGQLCKSCRASSSYPAPACLKTPKDEELCVHMGLPGELYPNHPVEGTLDYKVVEMGSAWLLPATLAAVAARHPASELAQLHPQHARKMPKGDGAFL